MKSSWVPTAHQASVLKIIMSMTTDSLMGSGTTDVETYVCNLKSYCKMLEKTAKGK